MSSAVAGAEPIRKPAKKGKGKRGKKSSRPRGGVALKEAGGDLFVWDTIRLRAKLVAKSDLFQANGYSIQQDGSHTSTGWQGRNPPLVARKEIRALYRRPKDMQAVLETFFPVPAPNL